jgi:hypothetical protein
MSKVAMITDTHFGRSKGNDMFLQGLLDFMKKQFFPYLRENGITTILHLGDFFDNRHHINVRILHEAMELLDGEGREFTWHILCGNHDSHYRSTIEVNSLRMFKKLPHVNIIDDIQKINVYGLDILMVPWIVDQEDFIQRVENKNTDCEVCCGHFETMGFKLNNKAVSNNGIKSDVFFRNFKLLFSGHFHTRSMYERDGCIIQYVGNVQHLTRHDIGDDRGFTILDTDTRKYEFINNIVSQRFVKVKFPEKFTKKEIKNNYVDVEIEYNEDYDEEEVQKYLRKVEKYEPAMPPFLKIDKNFQNSEKDDYRVQSVQEIIKEYIESLQIDNKDAIFNKIENLYAECRSEV